MITSIIKSKSFRNILSTLFWVALWYLLAIFIGKEVILPTPIAVIKRLWELIGQEKFLLSTVFSVARILTGLLIGCVIGFALGAISFLSLFVKQLFAPVMAVIKATPVASFIILVLVWLKSASVPSFVTILIVVPIVCENICTSLDMADAGLLECAKIYKFSALKKIKLIYLPSIEPYFFASLKTSVGLSFKAGIAAEVLCTPKMSIGKGIYDAKIYLETADIFAWTVVVILLSVLFEVVFVRLLSALAKKRGGIIK